MCQILVVDDEKNVLKTLTIGLQRHSFNVMQAQTGTEALKIIATDKVDFVVSDIRMYPMDGYTLASKIKTQHPEVGIIFMSAYGFEDSTPLDHNAHFYPHLTKPFTVSELVETLKEAESKRKTEFKKILFIGDPVELKKVQNILTAFSCQIESFKKYEDTKDKLKKNKYDLYLIENNYLRDHQWKILNLIDQYTPHLPVALLVSQKGNHHSFETPDMKVTLLQKERFLMDENWALKMLKNILA